MRRVTLLSKSKALTGQSMAQTNHTLEDNPMNQDIFAGQWKQMRGALKSWWGKLADDDFDRIGGQKDQLIGIVQRARRPRCPTEGARALPLRQDVR